MKPPILATWLLARFPVSESIIGDLFERYDRRPSSLWFWRQTASTIIACLIREVRAHKFVTFRAVLVGTLAVWCFSWLAVPAATWIIKGRLPEALPWALAGWTVARFHRHNGLTMVVAIISCWFLFVLSVMLRGVFVGILTTSATMYAFLATVIPRFLAFAAFTLAGGLVAARPINSDRQPAESQP